MNYTQAVEWVHSLPRFSKENGLDNIKAFLQSINNPQDSLKFVHIAGTNGKGSATIMLASILTQAGYKTGANISPFVLDFAERFQINGKMIEEERLAEILTKVRKASVEYKHEASIAEFEAVTAAAFLYFAEEKCDVVCLEVGIGGRLDATNTIKNTLVSCIMHIAKDHTELLGDSLEKIAAEKCAIFKNECDVVAYPVQDEKAMETILKCAQDKACKITVPQLEDFYFYKSQPFENRINYGGYDLIIPFVGKHQAYNAAVALEAALRLCEKGFDIDDEHIINGIQNAKIAARIEVISKSPLVLLDGAHNPDGASALAQTLQEANCGKLVAVMGVLSDKNPEEMLKNLAPHFCEVYTVTPDSPRALSAEKLAALANLYVEKATPCANLQQAISRAKSHGIGLCVCGSLYLAAEARKLLTTT